MRSTFYFKLAHVWGSEDRVNLPSLEANGQMIRSPSALVIFVKSELKVLKPLDLLLLIVFSSLRADNILDHDTTVLVELVAPVTIVSGSECDQVGTAKVWSLGFFSVRDFGGGHHSGLL